MPAAGPGAETWGDRAYRSGDPRGPDRFPLNRGPRNLRKAATNPGSQTDIRPNADDMSIPDILVLKDEPISPGDLRTLTERFFIDMVKYVVDIEQGIIAVGGELHSDAEAVLLDAGSRQVDLWGANYYPGLGPRDCIEYTALINIRPSQGNRSMVIEDGEVRAQVEALTFRLIGRGEAFP